jgi:uncharacterized protein (TIGR03067 family)
VLRSMILVKVIKLVAVSVCTIGIIGFGFSQVPTKGPDPKPAAKESPKDSPSAKEAPRLPARSDAERFKGAWIVESTRRDGGEEDKYLPAPWVGEEMTFDGEKVKFARFPGREKLYKLDPGWDQKRIDFEFRDVQDGTWPRKKIVPSIYRFEGEKLHIVFGIVNLEDRPESFDVAKNGSPFTHILLKRAEPKEPKDSLSEEQKRLEGRWVMIAIEAHGERKAVSGTLLIFKGNRFTLRPSGESPIVDGEYKLDADAYPRQIELQIVSTSSGAGKGKTLPGIYALNRGELTLCLDEIGTGRPKNFKGDDFSVMCFVREGEEPRAPASSPPATGRLRELQTERVKALRVIAEAVANRLRSGTSNVLEAVRAEEELAAAEMELVATPAERTKILDGLVARLKGHEKVAQQHVTAGVAPTSDEAFAKAARLKAEIELEKQKAGK